MRQQRPPTTTVATTPTATNNHYRTSTNATSKKKKKNPERSAQTIHQTKQTHIPNPHPTLDIQHKTSTKPNKPTTGTNPHPSNQTNPHPKPPPSPLLMEVFTSGHRSFTLEFLFVAKWVNDQWRAWVVSVSQRDKIGDGEIGVVRSD